MRSRNFKINSDKLMLILFGIGLFLPTYNNVYAFFMLVVCGIGVFSKKIRVKSLPLYYFVYFLIYVSTYFIHRYSGSMINSITFFITVIVTFYFVVTMCNTQEKLDYLLHIIILVGAIYAVLGILESLTSTNVFDLILGRAAASDVSTIRFGLTRNRGLCSHSINNGMFLFHILGFGLYLVYGKRKKDKTDKICLYLIFFDLLLTLGRAVVVVGIVAYVFVVLLLMDDRAKRSGLIKRLLISFPIAALFVFVLYRVRPEIIDQVGSFFSSITVSSTAYNSDNLGNFSHRVLLWSWVYDSVKNNLMFGVGFTTGFVHRLTEYTEKTSIEVHWLYILFQRGLYGLSGFIILQIGAIKDFVKTHKRVSGDFERLLKVELVIIPLYFILLFTCSGFEDLRFLYLEIAILCSIKAIIRKDYSYKERESLERGSL